MRRQFQNSSPFSTQTESIEGTHSSQYSLYFTRTPEPKAYQTLSYFHPSAHDDDNDPWNG